MLSTGQLSPDRAHFWDGQKWASAISADGHWRWDGLRWVSTVQALSTTGYAVPVAQPGAMVVAPKNPAVSLIVSLFIPGVGSMVNGDAVIGVVILFLWIVSIGLDFTLIGLIVGIPLGIATFVWALIDAYTGARRWNARHGIIS